MWDKIDGIVTLKQVIDSNIEAFHFCLAEIGKINNKHGGMV